MMDGMAQDRAIAGGGVDTRGKEARHARRIRRIGQDGNFRICDCGFAICDLRFVMDERTKEVLSGGAWTAPGGAFRPGGRTG